MYGASFRTELQNIDRKVTSLLHLYRGFNQNTKPALTIPRYGGHRTKVFPKLIHIADGLLSSELPLSEIDPDSWVRIKDKRYRKRTHALQLSTIPDEYDKQVLVHVGNAPHITFYKLNLMGFQEKNPKENGALEHRLLSLLSESWQH